MLKIYLQNENERSSLSYKLEEGKLPQMFTEEIVKLVANSFELEYIRNRFRNIPMHNGSQVVWTKENAQFIIENWA